MVRKEKRMNLLHLKYVVCIAENGSINKAAEELHVAQPNLSRVVREMENELGIQFFRRSSRGMMLTPDGELFVSQAHKILEQVEKEPQSSVFPFLFPEPAIFQMLSLLFPERWAGRMRKSFIRKPTHCRP